MDLNCAQSKLTNIQFNSLSFGRGAIQSLGSAERPISSRPLALRIILCKICFRQDAESIVVTRQSRVTVVLTGPSFPIQTPILNRLSQMFNFNFRSARKVSNRSAYLQYPVIGTCR